MSKLNLIYYRRLLMLLLLAGAIPDTSWSQSMKKYLREATRQFNKGDFINAQLNYKQALLLDSSNLAVQYQFAESCRNILFFDEAEHWYERVCKNDKEAQFPEASFWLAYVKQGEGNYKDAKALYTQYVRKYKKKNNWYMQKASQEILSCDFALQGTAGYPDLKITHLDSTVNSTNAEFGAYELDDSLLYFTSMRMDKKQADKSGKSLVFSKIYLAHIGNERQKQSELLDSLVNEENVQNGNMCFSPDKTRFYFTRCTNPNKNMLNSACEIYIREYKNGNWQKAVRIAGDINAPGFTSTQPNSAIVDSLGEVLFFASDRPGGIGKMDIWAANIGKEGLHAQSYNLGKTINSIDNEITPFYDTRHKSLFFSSDWYPGFGGFDIFRSIRKNGAFGAPENAGLPVNSPQNDLYYSISSKGHTAYLTSNRIGSLFTKHATCCNDIWAYTILEKDSVLTRKPVDSTRVRVNEMKLLIPITLYFHNDEPDARTKAITTNKNYKKTFDEYYQMKEKYKKEFSTGLKPGKADLAMTTVDDFFEDSVAAGMKDLDKFAELLLKILRDGEQVKITMKGYCSPLASTEYNVNLAKRRISSLQNYFTDYRNGIFKSYMNATDTLGTKVGKLEFLEEDIGELKATSAISDDYFDVRNSIYNPGAAAERKIQIIAFSSTTLK
jgi:hypothetical protein